MNTRIFKLSVLLFTTIALLSGAGLTEASSTSGGLILKQAVGARAQGMGEAFTAVADDATGLYWNVGCLSRNVGTQLSASFQQGLANSTYGQFMATHQLGSTGGIGLGLVLFQGGNMILDEPDGSEQSVQSQIDLVAQVGYGINLMDNLGVGISIKLLDSTLIGEVSATALAGDVGVLLAVDKHLSLGISVQNIGADITYEETGDPMPLTARLGGSYKLAVGQAHAGTLAVDLVKENDQNFAAHAGLEYWYAQTLALRLGYKGGYELENLTVGMGARWQMVQVDYAFSLIKELDHTHKVSLSLRL